MKHIVSIAVAIVIASCASTKISESKVPAPVKAAFAKLYPTADDVDWEKENENYEADFEVGEKENSAVFDSAGNLLESEVEINPGELPATVTQYINTNYAGSKIKEAAKITNASGVVTYEAEIKGKDLVFDAQGGFIKEVIEK